jgi:hypothetical protein
MWEMDERRFSAPSPTKFQALHAVVDGGLFRLMDRPSFGQRGCQKVLVQSALVAQDCQTELRVWKFDRRLRPLSGQLASARSGETCQRRTISAALSSA